MWWLPLVFVAADTPIRVASDMLDFEQRSLEPGIVRFSEAQGLPTCYVFAIARDQHDRLHLGTSAGAFVFSGGEFQPVALPKQAGLSTITTLAISRDNHNVWYGTQAGGVLRCDNSTGGRACDIFSAAEGLPSSSIWKLAEHDGQIYAGTSGGLARFDSQARRFMAQQDVPKTNVRALLSHSRGLVVGTDQGLFLGQTDGNAFAPLDLVRSGSSTNQIHSPNFDQRIWGLAPRSSGGLYVGSESELLVYDWGGITQLISDDIKQAQAFAEDIPSDTLWVGTNTGISRVVHGRAKPIQSSTLGGLPLGIVYALHHDHTAGRPSVLWVGSDAGLLRAPLHQFHTLLGLPRLAHGRISSLTRPRGDNSSLWLSNDTGVTQLAAGEFTRYELAQNRPGPIWVIAPGPSHGSIMIGTQNGDLDWFNNGRWQHVIRAAPNEFDTVFDIEWADPHLGFVAKRTGAWMASLRQGKAHFLKVQNSPNARCFAVQQIDDAAWFGCEGSLGRVANGSYEEFSTGAEFTAETPYVSLTHAGDKLWVATGGAGAFRIDLKTARIDARLSENSQAELPNNFVNWLHVDSRGRVFVSTDRGLAMFSADLSQRLLLGKDNGLVGEMGVMNAGFADADGTTWFATTDGVAVMPPDADFVGSKPASLHSDGVWVNHSYVPSILGQTLGHDRANLEFRSFLGTELRERDVRYRSQLVGLEEQSTGWSKENKRFFTTLPSGDYELSVWAQDEAGREIGPNKTAFSVAPPPWKTWWAYSLYAVLFVGASVQFSRLRMRQLQARAQMLEETVHRRTEEIRQKNEALEQQKSELEQSYREADLIFGALKQALAGKILDDRFQLGEVLGEGGFGIVYEALEVRTGRKVAAKIFRPQAGNDSTEALERFKREAVVGKLAKHPHAVEVIDAGVSKDNVAYIIMELLDGHSLHSELKRGKIELRRACEIMLQTLDALATAHEVGLIHRDIKPDNIYLQLADDGRASVKVLDFGIAKALKNESLAKRSMTMSGSVVGTPTYVAPERLKELDYDGRSDVYACGVVFYEMLVGRPPFESTNGNLFSVVIAALNEAPPPLAQFDDSLPVEAQQVIDKALVKDPEQRPTARQWAEDVRGLLAAKS